MKRIGIISDTHGSVHAGVLRFLKECDEVWHAGDMGSLPIWEQWSHFKPLVAVYGNIDDYLLRQVVPKVQRFECEQCKVLMTHIGGYPGKYGPGVEEMIREYRPDILVAGHSHILKVMRDPFHHLMYFNPGAAGESGFHKSITALRLKIENKEMKDLEVLDIAR